MVRYYQPSAATTNTDTINHHLLTYYSQPWHAGGHQISTIPAFDWNVMNLQLSAVSKSQTSRQQSCWHFHCEHHTCGGYYGYYSEWPHTLWWLLLRTKSFVLSLSLSFSLVCIKSPGRARIYSLLYTDKIHLHPQNQFPQIAKPTTR